MTLQRLLVVGKNVPRLKCVPWSEWQEHNLLDYQGLLLDCRNPGRVSGNAGLTSVLSQSMQHGHQVFLILPESTDVPDAGLDLNILPHIALRLQREKGKTLVNSLGLTFFARYLDALHGHELLITARQTTTHLPHGWYWQIGIADNVKRAVCGQFASAFILHPPARDCDRLAINAILDFFKPDFEEPEPESVPDWSAAVVAQIPGITEIQAKKDHVMREIAHLQSGLDSDAVKKRELEKWAEMLWLDGIPLQTRVSEALEFLGIPNQSKDPTGHTQDLQGTCQGCSLLFEVTGSNGAIGVEKGRQLLQWISECEDPTNAKGILVGNAHRKHPPEKRPPTPDHKMFVKEVEDMAARFHFALLDVRDLFWLVVRKLRGEQVKVEYILRVLQGDGVITFPTDSEGASLSASARAVAGPGGS